MRGWKRNKRRTGFFGQLIARFARNPFNTLDHRFAMTTAASR
jgi:hypothetical protein